MKQKREPKGSRFCATSKFPKGNLEGSNLEGSCFD